MVTISKVLQSVTENNQSQLGNTNHSTDDQRHDHGLKGREGLANPTLDKVRRVMSLVYRHSQRYGLIPRNQESNPMRFVRCKTTTDYEAMILTPEQAYAVLLNLREPERTLALLAAGTGLRISECLGLQWQDVSFSEAIIQVRRTPASANVALFRDDAVEQNEAHHAADVEKDDQQDESGNERDRDESADQSGIDVRKSLCKQLTLRSALLGNVESRWEPEIAAARSHFASQKSDNRETRPLPEAERLEELPRGVLEGERNGIDCRDRHGAPRDCVTKKVLRSNSPSNSLYVFKKVLELNTMAGTLGQNCHSDPRSGRNLLLLPLAVSAPTRSATLRLDQAWKRA